MPTFTVRHHLAGTLYCLALGLCLARLALAANSPPPADQSDVTNWQPLPEVTVIGKMDAHVLNHAINQFIQSHARPSIVTNQLGRWHIVICPVVFGMKRPYAEFISRRIANVARSIGAPTLAPGNRCTVNVDVMFTPEPQAQLDFIAKRHPSLLGYDPKADVKQARKFTHPVQAWYMTGSRSLDGFQLPAPMGQSNQLATYTPQPVDLTYFMPGLMIDSADTSGNGIGFGPTGTAGSHLSHGLRSELMHVLIIVDSKKVLNYQLQTISDYIALLALTRIDSLDTCSSLPSILNLFASQCAAPPAAITAVDTAYLKALYGAELDMNLNLEQGDIHAHMLDAISNK